MASMIIPPKEIRETIDKVAPFVAQRGPGFEQRLKEDEKNKSLKLSFLNKTDPFHQYYLRRIDDYLSGKATADVDAKADDRKVTETSRETRQEATPVPEFRFSATLPPISAQDLSIVKLVAQYVARNGRSFITTMLQRESRDPQFDFLRANHALFPFFNVLVQQYTLCIDPPPVLKTSLEETSRAKIMERCKARARQVKRQRRQQTQVVQQEEADRSSFLAIDWSSFVVVETIEVSPEDDHVDLPPPIDLAELKKASLHTKRLMQQSAEPSRVLYESTNTLTHPPITTTTSFTTTTAPTAKCPRCEQIFPASELEEHMRIELLDPQWQRQRERVQQKQHAYPSNLATESAFDNLRSFTGADKRRGGDLSGGSSKRRAAGDSSDSARR